MINKYKRNCSCKYLNGRSISKAHITVFHNQGIAFIGISLNIFSHNTSIQYIYRKIGPQVISEIYNRQLFNFNRKLNIKHYLNETKVQKGFC